MDHPARPRGSLLPSSRSVRSLAPSILVVVAITLSQLVGVAGTGAATVGPSIHTGLDSCLGQAPIKPIAGVQPSRYRSTVTTAAAFDARSASWTQVNAYPVSIYGSGGICWTGGVIAGTYSASTSWKTFHSTGAFNVENPSATVDNLRVHNYGDGIRLRKGAQDWMVRGAHESMIHDDCVENDKLHAGVISQSLLDGCYVAFSARPTSSDTTSDGRRNTMSISGSLVWLQPMPTVYKGPAPGHGGFFKWDDTGRSPKLALHNNVFRVDQLPNHGSLGLPAGYSVTCSGNTIVWLGSGAFPETKSWLAQCPDTKIVTSLSVWSDAVADWNADLIGAAAPSTTTTTAPAPTTTTTSTTTAPTTTTSTSTSTTTSTTTTTAPAPTPAPELSSSSVCLDRSPLKVLAGAQTSRYTPSLESALAVDARTAGWTQVDAWPISIKGTGSVCWRGGTVTGTYSDTTTWDTFHSTGAFNVENPDSIVEDLRVHNYGDGIRLRDGATDWTVRGAHETFIHDDCVENDKLNEGVISDSFFNGCYVAFSTRPSSSDSVSDGRRNTMAIRQSLVRLQPMPTVYKGPAPGHGGFFKWDDTGRSPKLTLRDNVFRVDQLPNHGSLGLPEGYSVTCSGNTIVWLGSGAFPEAKSWLAQCPDTKIVTSRAVWDDAAAEWIARH